MFVWHACIIQDLEGARKSSELRECEVSCPVYYADKGLRVIQEGKILRKVLREVNMWGPTSEEKMNKRLTLLSSIIMALNPLIARILTGLFVLWGLPSYKKGHALHFIQPSDFQKHFVAGCISLNTLWFLLHYLGHSVLRNLIVQPSTHLFGATLLVLRFVMFPNSSDQSVRRRVVQMLFLLPSRQEGWLKQIVPIVSNSHAMSLIPLLLSNRKDWVQNHEKDGKSRKSCGLRWYLKTLEHDWEEVADILKKNWKCFLHRWIQHGASNHTTLISVEW